MNTQQKPTLVSVIAWMTLVSGIVNLFWGLAASGTALATIVGIICTPLTILPTILGVFELIYAAKLLSNPVQPVKPSTNIAVFEIACVLTGNVFSMAVGILALVFYNDSIVRDYFMRLNGTLSGAEVPLEPAPQPTPVSLPDPMPVEDTRQGAPAIEEPVAPPTEESPAPPVEETPAKPKRGPRKMA
jgi:hypothetical protein